ncbi:hypothetical protein [Pontibacter mangrovi]|uniref:Uncharacterized protein n=1 Tax=Pontibacter mangrovi TaxID=2589816 RepID=A0A501VZ02_9BACT|nr:hypothetical protein [Pontibacter mangrovi]TPE41074.1 hypothetical protein FJM65_19735 [Pontibacter mangrovi]
MKNYIVNIRWHLLPLFLLGIWPAAALAQYRPSIDVQEWPSGKVVLLSGDTIYGPLTFYRSQEVVSVLNKDGTKSSFSPVNVQYFVAREEPSGRPYTFRSLPWNMGRGYTSFKKPTFFEELTQGPYGLMMRESYMQKDASGNEPLFVQNSTSLSEYYIPGSEWANLIKPLYYVLLPNGEVATLRNVRKDLYRLFGDKARQVKKFVRERNLSFEKPHQLMAIINYYNALE